MKPFDPNRYEAIFTDCEILHLPIVNHRAGSASRHRCLNYTLQLTAPNGARHQLSGGIPMDNIQGPYAHITQFLRQIGWFRDTESLDAKELLGHRVFVDTGITFDKKLGIRPYATRFHPVSQ